MAEPIKSVLLVDYDSLQRSLAGAAGETRLADRASSWLSALEAGKLGPDGVRRRLMVKRCYAGSNLLDKQRATLTAAGFEVIDAPEGTGSRSAIDMQMAMDTMEALSKAEGFQEFILLATGSELAPLLNRLKASKRVSIIYADGNTFPSDRALADAVIESRDLGRFLAIDGSAAVAEAVAAPPPPANGAGDRADIEAFARRIHAATSIPLFSPKTFAELFRHLTDEISANGYHFQSTAKNVAERMVASGRNVTRRQVVFIVKGLALKGHVFSTNDTPEKLAEVFREQAHYLITNAGVTLDARQENLLSAWFLSRAPSVAPGPLSPVAAPVAEVPDAAKATIAETIEREVAKAVARPQQPERVKISPPRPTPPAPAKPTQGKPAAVKPIDLPKSAAAKPLPFPSAREEAKAVIAARIAGAAKMKPAGTRAPLPAKPAPKVPTPTPPPQAEAEPEDAPESTATQSSAPPERTPQNADALESSILAAIAEAVDVLVEDSEAPEQELEHEPEPPPPPEPPKRRGTNGHAARQPEPPPPKEPEPEAADDGDSNDIGDQIQRIIASYNRNRSDE